MIRAPVKGALNVNGDKPNFIFFKFFNFSNSIFEIKTQCYTATLPGMCGCD